MENIFTQKVINTSYVFDDHFLDTKVLYLYYFNGLPSLNFIRHIDGEKTFEAIKEKFGAQIKNIHLYRWFKREKKQYEFGKTIIVLENLH